MTDSEITGKGSKSREPRMDTNPICMKIITIYIDKNSKWVLFIHCSIYSILHNPEQVKCFFSRIYDLAYS